MYTSTLVNIYLFFILFYLILYLFLTLMLITLRIYPYPFSWNSTFSLVMLFFSWNKYAIFSRKILSCDAIFSINKHVSITHSQIRFPSSISGLFSRNDQEPFEKRSQDFCKVDLDEITHILLIFLFLQSQFSDQIRLYFLCWCLGITLGINSYICIFFLYECD